MKRVLQTAVFTLCLAAFSHGAAVPVQNMSSFSLGAEYYGMLHGHEGLYDFDKSALGSHFLRLHYAPLPYARISAGLGGSHAYASPMIDGSSVGFSATAGLGLYYPKLLDWLSVTGGYDGYHLAAKEKDDIHLGSSTGGAVDTFYVAVTKQGNTTATLHKPYLGVIFHLGRFADIEVGGLYQYFEITKKNSQTWTYDVHPETKELVSIPGDYKNGVTVELQKQPRFYTNITLHERESGAYLTGGVSAAVQSRVENKSHLTNFSFWSQIGLIMRDTRGTAPKRGGYHSDYARMKRQQDRMAGELSRDIDRDRQRRAEERKSRGEQPDENDDVDVIIINADDDE